CYVNNFQNQNRPCAISLPAGKGADFASDISDLLETARREIPVSFDSEEYVRRKNEIMQVYREKQRILLGEFNKKVQEEGFTLKESNIGMFVVPLVDGKPLPEDELIKLPQEQQAEIREKYERLQRDLNGLIPEVKSIEQSAAKAIKVLDRDVAMFAIGHIFSELKEKYHKFNKIQSYLDDLREDLLHNIPQLKGDFPASDGARALNVAWLREVFFRKYQVNVVVDNADLQGVPVIMELNPTYGNIFGRIEKEAQFGTLVTDFSLIRGGSLHRANGGYLVLPVEELLVKPLAWEGLKRALSNEEISLEEGNDLLRNITTKTLRPQPIPLDIKIILYGSPFVYRVLHRADRDFNELFKIKSEFDIRMDRNKENIYKYSCFFCTLCNKEELKHLDATAVSQLVEHGSRLAEDQRKLSTQFSEIADIIREANFYANKMGSEYITAEHIKNAIKERFYRAGLVSDRMSEYIDRDIILIDTKGSKVGQVNSLSVLSFGDVSFGKVTRITASAGPGREGVIDIEREVDLGGNIHSKGILILAGYLTTKYARNMPLCLSASIVFEQSYQQVDGDSASAVELFALLSALAGVPVKQELAVTGSVNQLGEIQAIGGVNDKIEGFYRVCKLKGLTGNQGVIIPESNTDNLMLDEEIVGAVKNGQFGIYTIRTIDEGLELLTGIPAGRLTENGCYREGSVNDRVQKRLYAMARTLQKFDGS
ncbi:MAG TPA: ATP-binding protein, partial [Clostridia bacterium]|nr:ATP-binding protein [Clostridia bacterium]